MYYANNPNQWNQRFFVYRLNDNGDRYTLRYFKKETTAEKRCYCKDVYESFGQNESTFRLNFHSQKYANEIRAEGTNNRSMTCSFKDALTYVLDQYADLQHAFNERGVQAIEAGADGDIIGLISSFTDSARANVQSGLMNASNRIVATLPKQERRLYLEQLNQFVNELDKKDDLLEENRRQNLILMNERDAERNRALEYKSEIDAQKQRHIKTLLQDVEQIIGRNHLCNVVYKVLKGVGNIKPTWNSFTGTIDRYYPDAVLIFETYYAKDGWFQLAYQPGKRADAILYIIDKIRRYYTPDRSLF